MKVSIRDFRPSDRAHVVRCLGALQDHMVRIDPWRRVARTPDHGARYTRHILHEIRKNEGFVLIAEADREPVGIAVAWIRKITPLERTQEAPTRMGFLADIVVLPPWRRKGVGTRLLKATEQRFRRTGCDQISLGVFAPNLAARRLYRRHGYSIRALWLTKRTASSPRWWPEENLPRRRMRGR